VKVTKRVTDKSVWEQKAVATTLKNYRIFQKYSHLLIQL